MRQVNNSDTVALGKYVGKVLMDRFVRRENVKHYRDLLVAAKSDSERLRIQGLLDEELKKQRAADDDPPHWPSGPPNRR